MFCPKCGAMLMPKAVKGKKILICSCGYKSEGELAIGEKEKKKEEEKGAGIVDEEAEQKVMPVVEVECPECKNKQAYFWEVQTRAGDEPPTKFFKCTKCKHTWRDYS